jgi:dTDP-4-dehydrorhamnose 3,5-epimerase
MIKVQSLGMAGVYLLTPARNFDERGYFFEAYNRKSLEEHGLIFDFVQDNASLSLRVNTIRGLHFQRPQSAQTKLIWVNQGAIQDVIVDIRRSSATYRQHLSIELSASNGHQLLVPRGFAHGFRTIERDTVVQYKTDAYYSPEDDCGLRWNDPDLGIDWKCNESEAILSEKDRKLPLLRELPVYFS